MQTWNWHVLMSRFIFQSNESPVAMGCFWKLGLGCCKQTWHQHLGLKVCTRSLKFQPIILSTQILAYIWSVSFLPAELKHCPTAFRWTVYTALEADDRTTLLLLAHAYLLINMYVYNLRASSELFRNWMWMSLAPTQIMGVLCHETNTEFFLECLSQLMCKSKAWASHGKLTLPFIHTGSLLKSEARK